MKVTPLAIPDVLLIEPKVFGDERGFFYESFNQAEFDEVTGLDIRFVQDNHSRSSRSVLRGMHYQLPPKAQGKLVRVLVGEVFDVALDIRRDSLNFGKWVGERLSATNKRQMWIPPGFAHGFLVLSDSAEFFYKATDYYAPAYERSILWKDPAPDIDWPLEGSPVLSVKDAQAMPFESIEAVASWV